MNLLQDIITYVRRIVKSPSNAVLSDNLIIDYINRFWIIDVDARMQLFDLKTKYQFQTSPCVDQYNMPLYNMQTETGNQTIGMYPVYQGFLAPAYINGIQVPLYTEKNNFFNIWPNVVQYGNVIGTGDGTTTTFQLNFPILSPNQGISNPPVNGLLRGHVDMSGIIATGNNIDPPLGTDLNPLIPTTSIYPQIYITSTDATGANIVISDSGQFLTSNVNYGMLMKPGPAPDGNISLGTYDTSTNTINYLTGALNITFPTPPADGAQINGQCFYFETGLPRGILYYNNILTLRSPPDTQYLVELDAYLTPSAFLNTGAAIPFGYMAEYIARGAARKLLSDTGDWEQYDRYEPIFREQELLVWKRSQRQWTANRTSTIYVQGSGQFGFNNLGGGSI